MRLRWFLQAEWKFVVSWTLWAIVCGAGWMLLDRAANGGHFSVEGVGIALVMPVAGLISGPIMWRVFVLPRLQERLREADLDSSSANDTSTRDRTP